MSELNVRIVDLEPMRVAVSHGFGASPEMEAGDKMLAFLEAKGLTFDDVRWYGFNNPNPSPGSPNYGYDVWATVGPDVEAEGEITMREVPARRYAVARCEGLETIGEVWKQLVLWFEESPHEKPAHWCECLENLLTHPATPYDRYIFDLYLPIAG
ncbi:MAG TPA: GyrI-like domain-containing protein [Anaerolineae bacterium]|nr:GyrI-like domain-containing protein [Anaerolineae bacterium]